MTTQVNKELENIIKHDINYVILVSNVFGYKTLNETINSMNEHHKDFIRVYNKCKKDINASLKEELLWLKQEFELEEQLTDKFDCTEKQYPCDIKEQLYPCDIKEKK